MLSHTDLTEPERLQTLSAKVMALLPIQHKDIEKELALPHPYVGIIIKYMLAEGLIIRTPIVTHRVGNPAYLIERKFSRKEALLMVATSPCIRCKSVCEPATCDRLMAWVSE